MTAYLDKLRNTIAELREENGRLRDAHDQIATNYNTVSFTAEKRMEEIERLRAQLAERDALLRDLEELGIVEGGWTELDEILLRVKSALSASAEPSAPEVNHDPDCTTCHGRRTVPLDKHIRPEKGWVRDCPDCCGEEG